MKDKCDLFNCTHLWKRASNNNIQEFPQITTDLLLCTDCKSLDHKHKHDIDLLCRSIIMSGLNASSECIPITRSRTREVTGWTEHVKPERDRSFFWHWMWLESGKLNTV